MDQGHHGAECLSAERCEPLSDGGDELAAVFDEAGDCDSTQVGVALDTGLDVARDEESPEEWWGLRTGVVA